MDGQVAVRPVVEAVVPADAQADVQAAGLRRVAVASVVALAAVLPLAAATAGPGHGDPPRKDAAHSADSARSTARDD